MHEVAEQVFRKGIAPQVSDEQLESLKTALVTDDHRLIQGCTTSPPDLMCVADWPVESCCAISWFAWQGEEMTVKEVGDKFGNYCYECDVLLSDPGCVRHFLNWFDDTPRNEMRAELAGLIESILQERTK